jgi:probable non-F420 flavinoid oxidoreductase
LEKAGRFREPVASYVGSRSTVTNGETMTRIGYHASHEQFAPSALLRYVRLAEQAGFDCAKSSDHFNPWSLRQAQSGFAWSWLGAAMQATSLPFGIISAPGYRYHPAVLAQAAATIGEMFPGRLSWLALGSGEHLNESITGMAWPDKQERNARLKECAEITRLLFAGETVTHRGRVEVIEAKLWSRPREPVPIFGAAVTEATARFVGGWADGLLTTGGKADDVRKRIEAFREGGGGGKPVVVQAALSWAATEDEAIAQAMDQWTWAVVNGDAAWDLRRPQDFDAASQFASADDLRKLLPISSSLDRHIDELGSLVELGIAELHLLNVGGNHEAFLEAFGAQVLPKLRSS